MNDFDKAVLAAIEPLREAGFAIHWLRQRDKAPVDGGWSEAPVASLSDLRKTHVAGRNLGVRLGEPSLLAGGGYLHVLDLDIRVADLADEAWSRFAELFPDIDPDDLPAVVSGSGGESRHLYFVADKPFFSKKLAVSEGKHRRFDKRAGREVWSYDWEIELFGTGKQVAMPPSIHPDSGKPYVWLREHDFDGFDPFPAISAATIERLQVAQTSTYEFETREPLTFKAGQMERELDSLPVSRLDDYHDWVTLGQALHHQFGGSDEGFDLWVHHSKRSDKFDGKLKAMKRKWRGFGKNRRQPVTMATIRQWFQEARLEALVADFDDDLDELDEPISHDDDGDDFDDLIDAPAPAAKDDDDLSAFDLTPEEKVADEKRKAELEWTSLLVVNKDGDGWVSNLHNIELIVKNDPRLAGLAQLNEFTQETVQRTPPGQKGRKRKNQAKPTRELDGRIWHVRDVLNGELWSDDRDFAIRSIIEAPRPQGGYGIKVTDRDLKAAIVLAANEHAFHPVREYLSGLVWDGTPRVERLWIDFVKADDDSYHRDVARLMMVAAVTRIFEPGHKFDFATILEGLQGKRKSTLISVLGRRWFAELDGDFHDQKQMVELMQGAWIMEIPELTGFSRADVRSIKAFISRQKDRARLAYARRAGEFPRQCIFVGSTNDREYLKDDTGGRRFWPVKCNLGPDEEIDTDGLELIVDQLWAEAVALYNQMRATKPHGTLPLYLSNAESRSTAARLQESRRVESADDVLAGRIGEWLDRPIDDGFDHGPEPLYRNETCSMQVWVECLGGDPRAFKTTEQAMVNRALGRVPGWEADGSSRFKIYGKQRRFTRGGEAGRLKRAGLEGVFD